VVLWLGLRQCSRTGAVRNQSLQHSHKRAQEEKAKAAGFYFWLRKYIIALASSLFLEDSGGFLLVKCMHATKAAH
jgi:hypothetical protein